MAVHAYTLALSYAKLCMLTSTVHASHRSIAKDKAFQELLAFARSVVARFLQDSKVKASSVGSRCCYILFVGMLAMRAPLLYTLLLTRV